MGLLDDAASVISARTSHSKHSRHSKSHRSSRHKDRHRDRSRSKSRSRSRSRHRSSKSNAGFGAGLGGALGGIAASIFGNDDDHHHHDRDGTRSAFDNYARHNASRSSFFGGFGRASPSTSSYYKRSPRPGLATRLLKKLKRLLRDLVYYAKRHPLKVFMLVLMPLITGGALTALLARFGLRLPKFVERMLGMAAKAGSGDSMGVVGDAVRMVSGAASSGASHVSARVERGRDGGMQWEKRSLDKDYFGGGGGGGWGVEEGLKGIAKFFTEK